LKQFLDSLPPLGLHLLLLDQTRLLHRVRIDLLLIREFFRSFRGLFNICEPSHAPAVKRFTASAQTLGYLPVVNREERQRGVLRDSANQQRDLRLGAE
jgi:hypothetical protein